MTHGIEYPLGRATFGVGKDTRLTISLPRVVAKSCSQNFFYLKDIFWILFWNFISFLTLNIPPWLLHPCNWHFHNVLPGIIKCYSKNYSKLLPMSSFFQVWKCKWIHEMIFKLDDCKSVFLGLKYQIIISSYNILRIYESLICVEYKERRKVQRWLTKN